MNLKKERNNLSPNDNIITSRGPGTALDFALEIVSVLSGTDKRNQIEADLVRG